jgi:hypothetical protein
MVVAAAVGTLAGRGAAVTAGDQEYVRRLGLVLRQRDVAALRAFLQQQAERYGDERQVAAIREQSDADMEMILHRMILSRPDLADLHAESERQIGGGAPSGGERRGPPGRQPGRGSPGRHGPGPRRRPERPPGHDGSSGGNGRA